MRLQKLIRDSEGEGDGQFMSHDMQGEPGTETEYRIVLTAQEKLVIEMIAGMNEADTQAKLDSYFSSSVIALSEVRGEALRKMTEKERVS
jgi:hypothetical protein